ncbi:Putative alpha/beta hydrolase-like protein [Cladobotryum mycophilum]|uniref:Alpha/beta hydrolase-like protein n=1 Tax=Cladobotryum mycophilum TaxID=491253 RepID=A0ABR0T2L0_9HYPO
MDIPESIKKPTVPEPPDYENPLEASSRWSLAARAQAIRYAASLGFSIANRTEPAPPTPSTEFWVDSTLAESCKGRHKIKVDVWTPPKLSIGPRAAVISLHGGGWILGQGTDCARWAGTVMGSLDAVVFTVNYRLAPTHPFPVPIEDCVDAILQIAKRAGQFGIDPNKIILSGFSAGASSALSSWIILEDPTRFGYTLPFPAPRIRGLALFYPLLDWTISRPDKRQSCCRPDMTLSKGMTDLIDASYIYPPIARRERTDIRLSPGLMPDDLIQKLPSIHLCLCEYDMLLEEGKRFAQKLDSHNKNYSLRVVKGERHAWDCPPPMAPKDSVAVEYGEATQAMATWLGQGHETDTESMRSMRTKRLRIPRPLHLLALRSQSVGP